MDESDGVELTLILNTHSFLFSRRLSSIFSVSWYKRSNMFYKENYFEVVCEMNTAAAKFLVTVSDITICSPFFILSVLLIK